MLIGGARYRLYIKLLAQFVAYHIVKHWIWAIVHRLSQVCCGCEGVLIALDKPLLLFAAYKLLLIDLQKIT